MLILQYPIVVIGACLAIQAANAAPIRLAVISSSVEPLDHPALYPPPPPFAPLPINNHGCGGMRNKALDLANSLRKALGLKTIESHEPVGGIHILPIFTPEGRRPVIEEPLIKLVPLSKEQPAINLSSPPPGPHYHLVHPIESHTESQNFVQRIHTALGELGSWEARAVAFVLGCGIGVLFRMIWVFAVLLFRRSPAEDGTNEAQYALIIESVNEVEEPPKYDSNTARPGGFADEKSVIN